MLHNDPSVDPPPVEEERGADRWTVICWHDGCHLDTYGYGDEWPDLAREHVRETGHEVSVSLTRHDRYRPAPDAR